MVTGKTWLRAALIVCVTSSWAPGLSAQPRMAERPGPMPESVFFEVVRLFSPDSSRQRVDVQYRIDENFFISVKNSDTSFPYAFRRTGEVLVELTDSSSGTVSRDLDRVLIGGESDEPSSFPTRWYQGVMSFSLRPGIYSLNFEVTDHESHRDFADRTRKVRVLQAAKDVFELSDPMFIMKPDSEGVPSRIVPLNFGGEVAFGGPAALLLEVRTQMPDSAITVRYAIRSTPPSTGEPPEVSVADSFTVKPYGRCQLNPARPADQICYSVARGESNAPSMIILPFPGSKLLLRNYSMTMTIRQGGKAKEVTRSFRMVWPDMPTSLKDVDYALDILRYITTPSLLDSLRRGNYEERRKNLETFWKARDETPGTAYNEVMAEYYRRVDHATKSYGTLKVPDGSKSDRGRVYILYGPPSRTRRTLDPNSAFEEVWVYDRLKREFTFVDKNRNGTYELTETATQ